MQTQTCTALHHRHTSHMTSICKLVQAVYACCAFVAMGVSLYKMNCTGCTYFSHYVRQEQHMICASVSCPMAMTNVSWQVMLACNACMLCCSEATNGAEVVARMLEHIARHKGYIPIPEPPEGDIGTTDGYNANGPPRGRAVARAGAGRLRDAIVFGYMMQRHRARGKVYNLLTGRKRNRKDKNKEKEKEKTKTKSNLHKRVAWHLCNIQEGLLLTGVRLKEQ